ncbi:MAG: hypothetical protein M3Z16_02670 [Pseudomonadota bacterium]|nr:hypothetical protein [Pseudomonadota bacterium]
MTTLTQAERERSEDQDNYPSRGGVERVGLAWKLLDRTSWVLYKARHEALRSTVILVSGRLAPIASTAFYDDGSTYIRINDGLVEHLDTVCRIVAASGRSTSRDGVVEPRALPADQVDALLRRAYGDWSARERNEPVPRVEVPLGPEAAAIAEGLGNAAITFTVLHEYGHAALHRSLTRDALTQEPEADRWAARALFENAANARLLNYVLAGALMSIRALASRERVLRSDLHGYPPSEQRFADVLATAQQFFSDTLEFYARTTVAFSLDQQLQQVEHNSGCGQAEPPSHPEQVLSTIVAVLLEADHHMTADEAAAILLKIVGDVQPEVVAATMALAQDVLRLDQPCCLREPRIRRVVELFWPLAPRLEQTSRSSQAS